MSSSRRLRFSGLLGRRAVGTDDLIVGVVLAVVMDLDGRCWAELRCHGEDRRRVAPLQEALSPTDDLRIASTRAEVRDAPLVQTDGLLTDVDLVRLERHYVMAEPSKHRRRSVGQR